MKKVVMMLSLALLSLGTFAQHDHSKHNMSGDHGSSMAPEFENENLQQAYNNYIALKDALVASDAGEAEAKAAELAASLSKVENAESAQKSATNVMKAGSLEAQRKAFASLSTQMAELVRDAEISAGEVYVEFCPMANGGEGAHWLANEKQINNPYFGDKMLRCGKVKETIK
ncbi:MAG: DUF3347 domain-containing protein [Cyclobacteriaceae bacterium]|uniref:DUF3347 domain-containing protein n=1 Tax=Croceimicrobium sp. TaxID=2828340 RepID=UPI0029C58CBB|nr:DUF3347 domain-containing protein [Cyclobacteriaceae bacterium]